MRRIILTSLCRGRSRDRTRARSARLRPNRACAATLETRPTISMADSTLAPVAQPPAPAAPGDIPVDKIKVPPGFKVSLWAHGMDGRRRVIMREASRARCSSAVAWRATCTRWSTRAASAK